MKAFDLHCDTIPIIRRNGWDLVNDQCHVSIDKFAPFEHYVQCFAIAVNDRDRGQVAIDSYETKLAYWKQQAEKYSDRIFWAKSGKELETSDKPILFFWFFVWFWPVSALSPAVPTAIR